MASNDVHRPWLKTYPDWLPVELRPSDLSLLDEFLNASAAYPADPCIHYFDRSWSYEAIRKMAASLAGALAAMGTNQGDRVILVMQNIPQAVVACLAIWMRNAVVVPLNPMYTGTDLAHYLQDCGARLFICQDDLYEERVRLAVQDRPDVKVITTCALDMLDPGSTGGSFNSFNPVMGPLLSTIRSLHIFSRTTAKPDSWSIRALKSDMNWVFSIKSPA